MVYIVSKASQGNEFVKWVHNINGSLTVKKTVEIKGNANVIDPHTLETSKGCVTEIEDEDYEWLKEDAAFKDMVAKGFMIVEETKKKADDKAEEDHEKDGSAQLTDEDFEKAGQKAPVMSPKYTRKKK